jgi:hypothetical protein
MIAEEASVSDEAARQIESEVIDELYKSTVGKLQSRREQYRGLAEESTPPEPGSTDRYKSYLDELRKEYRSEKQEKIRNKSFEHDKSARTPLDASFNGNLTVGNILPPPREAENGRLEPDPRGRDKETVIVRNEIRNRPAINTNGSSARAELTHEGFGNENGEGGRHPYSKQGDRLADNNSMKDDFLASRLSDRQARLGLGQAPTSRDAGNLPKDRSDTAAASFETRFRYDDTSKVESGDLLSSVRAPRDYGVTSQVDIKETSALYSEVMARKPACYSVQKDRGDIYQATTLAGGSDYESKGLSSPKPAYGQPRADSSDKKHYTWNDEKQTEEGPRFGREKSRDPFEDKLSHRIDDHGGRESPVATGRRELGKPPLRDRSPPLKDDFTQLRSDRGRIEGKTTGVDKGLASDRAKREDLIGRSPEYPSKDIDPASLLGKCKRLETENHILLKNNAELRRENSELKDKLAEQGDLSDLKDKIRELLDKNKRMELQLMTQHSSPLITPKTPMSQTHQFFGQYGKGADDSKVRGQSGEKLPNHHESFKHLPHTERRKLTRADPFEKQTGTKLKFADSVLGMLRQLVDLSQGDDECRHAWKILKNVVGEYVDLKRESKAMGGSPLLPKLNSTHSEHLDSKSTDRGRLKSEERNRWRERNYPKEPKNSGYHLG